MSSRSGEKNRVRGAKAEEVRKKLDEAEIAVTS